MNATSHLLELSSVNQGQSGEYTCLAFNNHTDMKSSVTKHIVIAGRSVCTVTSASVFIHLDSIFTLAESPQSCQDVNNRPSTCGSSPCCYCLDSSNCQACYDNAKMIEFMVPYKAKAKVSTTLPDIWLPLRFNSDKWLQLISSICSRTLVVYIVVLIL